MEYNRVLVPNEQGFITNWLVSGVDEEPFEAPQEEKHQIKYEQYLREIGIDDHLKAPIKEIKLGAKGCKEHVWTYYHSKNNWFVDLNSTYKVPTKTEAYAVTELVVEEPVHTTLIVWTYAAVDVWLEDKQICSVKKAVYKPIQRIEVPVQLKTGKNTLFIRLQNVGVRDTRNTFGVQIQEGKENIQITLPDRAALEPILEAEAWLAQVSYRNGQLNLHTLPPSQAELTYHNETIELVSTSVSIGEDVKSLQISIEMKGNKLSRTIEIAENWKPYYTHGATTEETHQAIYQAIAKVPHQDRGRGVYFSAFHILARYATNSVTEEDRNRILTDLVHIRSRVDCSDFFVVALLRIMKNYQLDDELLEEIKKTLLQYRYWMDEDGSDGMCFWSENHALMFNCAQMVAGSLYPDEVFLRSQRTGREQAAIGEARCRQWLEDVEKHGFEEFSSATYMGVTAVALLALIDFAPEDMSERASKLLDEVLELFSRHIFDGVIIAPQGRVYRDVIYPFKQSAQELVHFINKDLPGVIAFEGPEVLWLSCFATSKYEVPLHLIKYMNEACEMSYISAYAEVNLKKTDKYILTSVTSPREEEIILEEEELIPFTSPWVKEMNMRYHGTTLFRPGVYGYQQHMWYAALAKDCPIFVNHPGTSTDESQMRPGYWYGNGIFPAVKQKGNILGAIYQITQDHPIHFTHLYWPTHNLDEEKHCGNWIFGRKEEGYIGIWCSEQLSPYQDVIQDREYRAYSSQAAYVCHCASAGEIGSFEQFIEECMELQIEFNKEESRLIVEGKLEIEYIPYEDHTQQI